MDIEQFRREYLSAGLRRADLSEDPIEQFARWLDQAVASAVIDPTAMVLATVGRARQPWQRIVLLKDYGQQGFVFYTNTASHKALAMAGNPDVSLLFPWHALERQVIVAGVAGRLPDAEASRYFATRPRASQLAAWASAQSRPLASRALLEERFRQFGERFGGGEIPRPDFWGGYRVVPRRVEFWQGNVHRLHDRFLYTRQGDAGWRIERLQP